MNSRLHFAFLNAGHFIDHLLPLVFATVAALVLTRKWGMSYAELIPYATPALVVFGLGALPAGWLADRWSRQKMMVIFFFGIGASAIATAYANTPLTLALGLFAIGLFGSIYHPVGLAMVIQGGAADRSAACSQRCVRQPGRGLCGALYEPLDRGIGLAGCLYLARVGHSVGGRCVLDLYSWSTSG